MSFGGTLALLVLVSFRIILDWDDSLRAATIVWTALILLALLTALIGCFTMRFELAASANKTVQATAAAPGS